MNPTRQVLKVADKGVAIFRADVSWPVMAAEVLCGRPV